MSHYYSQLIIINKLSHVPKMESEFVMEDCIREHHIYKDIWTPRIGETLICDPEVGNLHDRYNVAVLQGIVKVGHLPRRISTLCHLFLQKNGRIHCQVTGKCRYSQELLQGGLEVPCVICCSGLKKDVDKVIDTVCRGRLETDHVSAS